MSSGGSDLLHDVAVRIVRRWLQGRHAGVVQTGGRDGLAGRAVDLTFTDGMLQRRVKVKADPYIGSDPVKIRDHGLIFYRADQSSLALEAVANAATKEPGWVFDSGATDLYYYFLAISQPQAEVQALFEEPDDIFYSELEVERDELVVIPMMELRSWFAENFERFATRPVRTGRGSAWYRLVPRSELQLAVPETRNWGSIFARLG